MLDFSPNAATLPPPPSAVAPNINILDKCRRL